MRRRHAHALSLRLGAALIPPASTCCCSPQHAFAAGCSSCCCAACCCSDCTGSAPAPPSLRARLLPCTATAVPARPRASPRRTDLLHLLRLALFDAIGCDRLDRLDGPAMRHAARARAHTLLSSPCSSSLLQAPPVCSARAPSSRPQPAASAGGVRPARAFRVSSSGPRSLGQQQQSASRSQEKSGRE